MSITDKYRFIDMTWYTLFVAVSNDFVSTFGLTLMQFNGRRIVNQCRRGDIMLKLAVPMYKCSARFFLDSANVLTLELFHAQY